MHHQIKSIHNHYRAIARGCFICTLAKVISYDKKVSKNAGLEAFKFVMIQKVWIKFDLFFNVCLLFMKQKIDLKIQILEILVDLHHGQNQNRFIA